MQKGYIYKRGVGMYVAAYDRLNVIPGSDLDKWLEEQMTDSSVICIWKVR